GGGVPQAAGYAWANRQAGSDAVAVTFFGDGAVNIGSTLETFNLASAWKLPVCFFIENNLYAVSTSVYEATGEPRLSARGLGFNIPSWKVDGMDPLAVNLAMQEAVAHMRAGKGPTMIEADTYRYFHQNGGYPGSAFGYRSKEEERAWRQRDPILQISEHLVRRGIMTQAQIDAAAVRARQVMAETGNLLVEPLPDGKPGQRRIKPDEWPDPAFADVGVRGDLREFEGARFADRGTYPGQVAEQKLIDAIAAVLGRRMETDTSVVVMGEDVHRLNGGTNGATRGLKERFPDRILGTPISENAFAGLGGGIALDGRYKPIVEFMYADFMWVAADQLFNQIAKARHMFGGDGDVPFVLRSKVATGTGYGSQHSMDPAGILATAPGLRIVAPTTPFDYVGLMNSALRCKDPVVVLEHVDLYNSTGPGPVDDYDYHLPVGRAAVRRTGDAVTVVSYLSMVAEALAAADETGVDAEVIDLRWLDRASLDWDTLGAS
ncbi:MAG: alpha-ketoacid dehydrogenase subunit alpha/beta, partial [Jiangellaceae bacterium]